MAYDMEDGERAIKVGAYRHAFQIFMMLCENSEDEALFRATQMALNDQLIPEERERLISFLEREIRAYNKDAAFNLAVLYWRVPAMQDIEKAMDLLQKCCRDGVPRAFVALAKLLMSDGRNLPGATPDAIVKLLQDGFAAGSIEAAWLIAKLHLDGAYVKKDDYEAFKWLFIAGRLGHVEARKHALMMQGLYPNGAFKYVQDEALDLIEKLEGRMVKFE